MRIVHKLLGLVVLGLSLLSAVESLAQTYVTHRYDIEPTSAFVTEPGWTHMDQSTAYTATSAGFHLGGVSQFTFSGIDRGSSTQTPTSVTRDMILGGGAGSLTVPTIVFRDIVPAHSTNVSFTIYRSDPGDSFAPTFETRVRYNGGTEIFVAPGSTTGGTYQPPITFNLGLTPTVTDGSLDFYFYTYPTANGASTRLNGIEAIYAIPEPSALVLMALATCAILRRRRGTS